MSEKPARETHKSMGAFKKCTCCGQVWPTRDNFLSDEHIRLNGYQANFKEPAQGLLLFIHFKKECGTSVAVKAEKFTDLYEGPFYPESARGSGECPGYCQGQFDLGRCDARCKNAYVRELLGIISRWSKDENDKKKVTGPASRIS